MRNQLETWFIDKDEDALSQWLRSRHPTLFFIDHDGASSSEAVARCELQDCGSGFAYIWNARTEDSEDATELWKQGVRRKSIDGTLQFLRSRVISESLIDGTSSETLLSGRIAPYYTGKGTPRQIELKKIVYRAVNALAPANVVPVSPTSREVIGSKCLGVRVGMHAAMWCQRPGRLLRHVAIEHHYCLPADDRGEA